MKTLKLIAASALCIGTGTVLAHSTTAPAAPTGHAAHGHAGMAMAPTAASVQHAWGMPGQPQAASRTITLQMTDDMRFAPDHIRVQQGETVRLRVENRGQLLHELVLGTPASLDEHAQMMLQHPGMAHSEAYMAHVAPSQRGELVWNFNRPGQFDFACLIAGHYQAGMRGTITVTP